MVPQYLQLRGLLHLRRPKGAGATELLQLRLQLTCRELSLGGLGGGGSASGPIQKASDSPPGGLQLAQPCHPDPRGP